MFAESFWGFEGFDELRKYLKQGTETSREIGSLLQERAELELNYAKGLAKFGSKLSKVTHASVGTLAESWALVGSEMEAEAELHRVFGQGLIDDVCKLIKNLVESQSKARKPIESAVDKSTKNFLERRSDETKCKKNSFSYTKDREKTSEQVVLARDGKGKSMSDKELLKLEKKLSQLDDTVLKSDKEYYDTSRKSEAAREDWETQVYQACGQLQIIENERIVQMQDMLNRYNTYLSAIGPKMVKSCEKLSQALYSINVESDISRIADTKGKGTIQAEQALLDYYAEDKSNTMELGRRKLALEKYLLLINQDLEKEQRGREGVVKLLDVYKGQPSFANAASQDDGAQRMAHVDAMIRYLEACQYKISLSLAELENQSAKPQSQYAKYIDKTRDKQGYSSSVLRMPSLVSDGTGGAGATSTLSRLPSTQRAPPQGASSTLKPPIDGGGINSFCDDDFDSAPSAPICYCKAVYDYVEQSCGELSIYRGDVIAVFVKHDDGWWQGDLNGRSGVFPASYVQQI